MATEKDAIFWVMNSDNDVELAGEPLKTCTNFVEGQVRDGCDAEYYLILREYVTCESIPAKVTFNKV